MYRSSSVNNQKLSKPVIVMFLSAVWTLILTAPIHCRGSISDRCIYILYFLRVNQKVNYSFNVAAAKKYLVNIP